MNAFDQSYGYFQQLERAGKWSIPWWSARFYAQLAHRYAPAAYPRRALDVGCGLGMLLAQLTPDFVTYGLDISAFALAVARRRAPHAHLVLGDAGSLAAFPGNYFHAVIAKHVLEHLPEPEEALGQCARLLVPKGVLIFGTPNTRSLLRPLKGKQWIGVRDPTHVAVLPPKVWLTLTAQAGLRILRVFSDGFWDVPYLPLIPRFLQLPLFAWPAALQVLLGWPLIPVALGESLLVIAQKPG